MRQPEAMLMGQAQTLQAIFNRLALTAMSCPQLDAIDVYLRLALSGHSGLAGRNLFTFTGFTGWDPEVGGWGSTFNLGFRPSTSDPFRVRAQGYSTYPIPRTVTATVEVAF